MVKVSVYSDSGARGMNCRSVCRAAGDHPIYGNPTRILFRPATEADKGTEASGKSMSRPGQEMTNGSKSYDQTTDGSHLTREDQRLTKTPSGICTIKEIVDANMGPDQFSEAIEDVRVNVTEEISHVVAYPLQKQSGLHPDAILIEDDELQGRVGRLVVNHEAVRIDTPLEEKKAVRSPAVVEAIETIDETN